MRVHLDPQASMFSYFSPEARVPVAHPLRSIKSYADTALKSLSRDFDDLLQQWFNLSDRRWRRC